MSDETREHMQEDWGGITERMTVLYDRAGWSGDTERQKTLEIAMRLTNLFVHLCLDINRIADAIEAKAKESGT